MIYTKEQLLKYKKNFVEELNDAREGKENSILYAKNLLPEKNFVSNGEQYQVIMMGGSHLESAIVSNLNGIIKTYHLLEEDLSKLASKEIVSELFLKHLNPNVKVVSVNFAYPMEPIIRDNKLDGILVRAPKEHTFTGLLGEKVGEFLENEAAKIGQKIDVLVCNDTTALGLAGIGFNSDYSPEEIMAGVVGTGFNFGLFENSELFINLESGNFDRFEQTESGKLIDSTSQNIGQNKFEKEVGGGYLCHHFNYYAEKNGLDARCESTKELSQIAIQNNKAGYLATQIFERSAQLVALEIASIFEFKKSNSNKMLALLEGSLYWKGSDFTEYVDKWLKEIMKDSSCIKIDSIDKIGIIGAAKLIRR